MAIPDQKKIFLSEDEKVTAWPTFGMTALSLMTVFPDPETGENVYPTKYALSLARALLTGDWSDMRQFDDLTPEEARAAAIATILWYDRNAPDYTAKIKTALSIDQIMSFVAKIPQGGSILDAGCGGGRDSKYFLSLGYKPTGIDLSNGMIKSAKKAHPELQFTQANFQHLPFPNNCFEGIWAHASIHHLGEIADVNNSLNEFNRVLKSNGILHLATQALTGTKDISIVKDILSRHNRFYRYFTLTQVEALLTASGFRIIEISQHKEIDDDVNTGRENVEWIIALAIKD